MRDERAVERARAELNADARSIPSLEALLRAHVDARETDAAWCVSSALVHLGVSAGDVVRRFERGRRSGPIQPKATLDDGLWMKQVRHPAQDLIVSKIFQQLWPAVLSLRGKTDRDAGLQPKHLVDPARSTITLARTFGWITSVLGLQAPRLYLRQDVQGGISVLPVYPLASLCGATLLQGFEPRDLCFVVARHLADYRGEHYLRTLMPSVIELKAVLLAALRIARLIPADPQSDAIARELLGKIGLPARGLLDTLSHALVASEPDVDVLQWLRAVELSACRAGLLICDDLGVAAKMIRALGAAGPHDVSVTDKIDAMIQFVASDEYAQLRGALQIRARFT